MIAFLFIFLEKGWLLYRLHKHKHFTVFKKSQRNPKVVNRLTLDDTNQEEPPRLPGADNRLPWQHFVLYHWEADVFPKGKKQAFQLLRSIKRVAGYNICKQKAGLRYLFTEARVFVAG